MAERRLFFALWPSDRQRELLRNALRPVLTTVEGTPVDRRNWHVTLVFIGSFPEAQIPFLEAAAGEVGTEPVRLRFDRLAYWPRPKVASLLPLAVPPALESLVGSLEALLAPFGREPEDRIYRPHITVARRVRAFETLPLARPVDLEWTGFTLVASQTLRTGAVYEPIAEFPR
ncbi:MAG TPA: RNA 2',3'-cyclic phosphodiesterase [Woeseiaceae bacterium]|nr:RNA 2',3'-cyclic phosphodiesterase [Woeseiaceae bacterium]